VLSFVLVDVFLILRQGMSMFKIMLIAILYMSCIETLIDIVHAACQVDVTKHMLHQPILSRWIGE
jgi:hypothetical protein